MSENEIDDLRKRLHRTRGLLVSFVVTSVGLLAVVIFGWRSLGAGLDNATADDDVKRQAVARLVELSSGIWDSFPDPDVARIHQPNLVDRSLAGKKVTTNAFGLREREFVVPKPADLVRVVLLGDSFVFGAGVEAEQRFGVILERLLRERGGVERPIEVLHVGVGSWNIRSETAYLTRNLSNFAPDLVIQILVSNDLNDTGDVRGFGAVADFTSQHRQRTVSIFNAFPVWSLGRGFKKLSYLNHGLGIESRRRYADAADRLDALQRALAARGARHLAVLNWDDAPVVAAHLLAAELPAHTVAYLPDSFRRDSAVRISGSDPHWSPGGHETVARYLYGAIVRRELLPKVEVRSWPQAEDEFESLNRQGQAEADLASPLDLTEFESECSPTVAFPGLTEQTARQIYGGVDRYGFVSPYAAIVLARDGGRSVRIGGKFLHRRELEGLPVRVFFDETEVGVITVRPGQAFESSFRLPPEIERRATFDVRFEADDYVYTGPALRSCTVFQLQEVSVVR